MAEYPILVQFFEDGVQLRSTFPHSGQFPLLPADLPLDLSGLPVADVLRELPGVFPGHRRHPSKILQDHLVQHTLPDVVGGADFSPLFLVGAAGEVVPGGLHRVRPVQHHRGSAVRAHHQPGVLVLLVHLGGAAPVLPHPLDNIPDLLGHKRGMRPLKYQTFLSGVFHLPLVLVGLAAESHVDGIAQIQLVFQHIRNRAVCPMTGLFQVQRHVTDPKLLIGIGRGA